MPPLWRVCKQCDKEFYLKGSAVEFFTEKRLELPKRCWNCRQINKGRKNG